MFGRRQLNTFQAAVALTYANGDYAHFVETGITEDDLNTCGDTLFKFLMLELADEGSTPMDADTAVGRMANALADVGRAFDVVVQAQQSGVKLED